MKKVKYLLVFGITLITLQSFSQDLINPDSLFINYKNIATICIANNDNSKVNEIEGITTNYQNFIRDLELIKNDLPDSMNQIKLIHKVDEFSDNIIVISSNESNEVVYYLGENKSYHKKVTPKYSAYISLEKGNSLIVQNNNLDVFLSDLGRQDLDKIVENAWQEMGKDAKNRVSLNFYYDHDGEKILGNTKEIKSYHKPMDQIELTGGVGVALDQHILVPDLNAKIAFTFAKKGIYKSKYTISGQWKYYFDENNQGETEININPFLNVGYEHNFSKNPNAPRWFGLEVGYLLKQRGDHYNDNTFRLAVTMGLPSKFVISPELYIGEDIYPGIRLVYGF